MSEEIKLVYTGSRAEGMWIKEILEEEKIGAIFRDTLSSSIQAGWADGSPEDAVRIFVEVDNYEKAKNIIEAYFENRKSTDEIDEKNKG